MAEATVRTGALANGKRWCVILSRTSAVPQDRGTHFVLMFEGDDRPQGEVPLAERKELLGVAYELASELVVSPGKFRIEVNGPTAANRPHLHIHIICPDADLKIRRSVDPIVASN